MDHDADHTHLNKLRIFRDDFLTLSGLTLDQFHEMALKRRAGEPLGDLVPRSADSLVHDNEGISPEQLKDLVDHVKELSEQVAALQVSKDEAEKFSDQLHSMLTWFEENKTALEGLLAGSNAAAHAITEAEGTEGAQTGETAPAGA